MSVHVDRALPGSSWAGRRAIFKYCALGAALVVVWAAADNLLPKGLPPAILLFGTVFGSLYALLGIGIVLVYRSSQVINFSQAEIGSVAAIVAIELTFVADLNYFVAAAIGLGVAAATGAIVHAGVMRRFANAPRFIAAIVTIAVAQILAGISIIVAVVMGGMRATAFVTPFGGQVFELHPVLFRGNHVAAMVMGPLVMLALVAFLRGTSYGVAIRAASDNTDRAHLLGVPVARLGTVVWIIAAVLSFVAVMLRVPIVGYASFWSVTGGGDSLLVRTLAVALIGRLDNMRRTVAAAFALGVFQEACAWTFANTDFVDAVLVLVILVAVVRERGFFRRTRELGASTWLQIKPVRPIPHEVRFLPEVRYALVGLPLAILALAATMPLWASPSRLEGASLMVIYAIAAVSLLVLTGYSGQVSLGQWAVVGFGAAVTALMAGRHGWPLVIALLAGIAVAAAVSVVVGIPSLGTRGPFYAITSLTFAVASGHFFLEGRYLPWLIQDRVGRPSFLGLSLDEQWQMFYFALAMLGVAVLLARNLRRTRTGRALIAVRDNEVTSQTFSLRPMGMKITAFVISGAIAGLAGGVYVIHQQGLYTGSYHSGVSIELFSMVVIGGLGSLPGVIAGVVWIRGTQLLLPLGPALVASGAGILVILMFLPQGLGGVIYSARDSYLRWVARRRGIVVPSLMGQPPSLGLDSALAELQAADGRPHDATPVFEAGSRPPLPPQGRTS